MRKFIVLLVVTALLAVAVAPSFAQEEPGTIADIVVASSQAETPEFTILLAAVQSASPDFLAELSNPDQGLTVFAPTDAAFAAALEALGMTAEEVLSNQALLDTILAYHIVVVPLDAASVVALNGAYVGTVLPDSPLYISVEGESVKVNDATVVQADVQASNGVVHVIDSVLVPPQEVIDAMMAAAEETTEEESAGTLADIAIASTQADPAEFTTLVAAVQAADPAILEGLQYENAYVTVFAPTDAAFAAAFEALGVKPEDVLANAELLNTTLLYHVVPGIFTSAGIASLAEAHAAMMPEEEGFKLATALPGSALTIKISDAGVQVNDANVAAADVVADNGIIHVIDGVLLPQ